MAGRVDLSESELYDNIINKINEITDKIKQIKSYVDNSNLEINMTSKYLEKFNSFSSELNYLKSTVDDMYDEFILKIEPSELKNVDKNRIKSLLIEKKVQDTFYPYMLYLQILLQNSSH